MKRLVPLTEEQRVVFENDYPKCPVCGEGALSVEDEQDPEVSWNGWVFAYVHCTNCGVELREEYKLVDAKIIDHAAP
jgi:hypothetical protein